jgi:hypothetical protein
MTFSTQNLKPLQLEYFCLKSVIRTTFGPRPSKNGEKSRTYNFRLVSVLRRALGPGPVGNGENLGLICLAWNLSSRSPGPGLGRNLPVICFQDALGPESSPMIKIWDFEYFQSDICLRKTLATMDKNRGLFFSIESVLKWPWGPGPV